MAEEVTKEEIAAAQRAVMLEDGCGLTIKGERAFCDDPRAIEPTTDCVCKRAGRAAAIAASQSRPTKEATPSASGLTSTELRAFWKSQGGEFHGPHVETGCMAEAKLLPLLRRMLAAAPAPAQTEE